MKLHSIPPSRNTKFYQLYESPIANLATALALLFPIQNSAMASHISLKSLAVLVLAIALCVQGTLGMNIIISNTKTNSKPTFFFLPLHSLITYFLMLQKFNQFFLAILQFKGRIYHYIHKSRKFSFFTCFFFLENERLEIRFSIIWSVIY